MKSDIHPEYYTASVTCSCGNAFRVGATVKAIRVEICAACHPFYTGNQKLVDTAGRVEKFTERLKKRQSLAPTKKAAKEVPAPAEKSVRDALKLMKQRVTAKE